VAQGTLAVVVVVGRLAGGHGHCLGQRWRRGGGEGGGRELCDVLVEQLFGLPGLP
jgi:hypothetical protein